MSAKLQLQLESLFNFNIHYFAFYFVSFIFFISASVRYKVVVQAFNNIGVGPFSEPVTQQEANTEGE